jgi:hypothetical protein
VHLPGVGPGTEARRLGEQLLALLGVEPGVEMGVGVEPDHGHPVLLHPGHRRLEPVATEALEHGFHRRNPALPLLEGRFLPWLHADGNDGRDRRRQFRFAVVGKEVHVILPNQQRLNRVEQPQPLLRLQPRARRLTAREALHDDPVDLGRRMRREDRLV